MMRHLRTTDTIAAANQRLRDVLMEEVGVCPGTTLLLRMVETVPVISLRSLGAECGMPHQTIGSAFFRAGFGPFKQVRNTILLYRLRCVMAIPDIRRNDGALALECSSPQAMYRFLQTALGERILLGQWLERTTPATVLQDWRELLKERRDAIRRVPELRPTKALRAVRLEWLRSEVAERERRLEAMRHEIERLERAS
jgi:hypothetical protein